MVIELTDGLAKCPIENLDTLSISIENLLIGYYEGNLILIISTPLCLFIQANGLVKSGRAKKALHAIEVRGGYIPNVLWRLQVVLENPNPSNYEVDYSFFSRSLTVQPTSFLCENLDDSRFYMKLARLYYPEAPIKASLFHGGGGTTVDVFSYLRNLRVVCLTILDSDIKYPGGELGDTASRCKKQYKKPLGYLYLKVLSVHEAENLVPVAFMEAAATRKGKALMKRFREKGLLDQLKYFDVKSGIKRICLDEDADYMNYCKSLYEKLYRSKRQAFEVYLSHLKDPSSFVLDQIQPNLLERFINDTAGAYLDDMFSPSRKEIAQLVYTYLCCRGSDPLNA